MSHCVFVSSSYLGPSGGNYGIINSGRIKRRPSTHFEMEISECRFLHEQIQNLTSDAVNACKMVSNHLLHMKNPATTNPFHYTLIGIRTLRVLSH